MNPALIKLKLEAIEDDKGLLARALEDNSDDDDPSESDASQEESASDSGSDSDYEQPQEDVKPPISVKIESHAGGEFECAPYSALFCSSLSARRLVKSIRLDEGAASTGILAKEWDFAICDSSEYREDLRSAAGIGRRRLKCDRKGPYLSFQTKALIGQGNQAYVDGDLSSAIRIMLQVIRIEPRAAAAWSVLAQCYEDQNALPQALQLRIMGAHLKQDADEWDSLARQSREQGYPQQALYCWAKGYHIDPSNVAALWDRAMLAKELGNLPTTRIALLGILERFPHDLDILSELRTVLIDLGDLETCAARFHAAFEHYQSTYPAGVGRAAASGMEVPGAGFALLEVMVLADLYNTLGEHERAVDVIRRGVRWLQGRKDEGYWDLCADDREFDCEGMEVARVFDLKGDDDDDGDFEAGYFELDVNARHRLAIARIKMGELEEGKVHADVVLAQDILDYAPLFSEIADAYFERDLFNEARAIYEALGQNETTSSVYILLRTAECLCMTDELQDAADVYEAVRKVDPTHNEAKMKLAEVYEILNEPRKALELVYEVIDSRRRRPKEPTAATTSATPAAFPALIQEKALKSRINAPTKKTNRLSNAELREMEAQKETEVMDGFRRLKQLWPRMLQGDGEPRQQWMLEAEKLIEGFRETRRLYSTSRTYNGMFPARSAKLEEGDEDRMLCHLHFDLAQDTTARKTRSGDKYNRVDIFRGVSFDDWLRLFFQYCFVLTESGNYKHADEVLRHLLMSGAYQMANVQDTIRVAFIACASAAGCFSVVTEQSRKLLMAHQFHNDPLRIMVSALGSGAKPTDAFFASTLQKFLHRELKMFDAAANNPESLVWSLQNKRFSTKSIGGADAEDENEEQEWAEQGENEDRKPGIATGRRKRQRAPRLPEIAKTPNPIVLALYGQMCLVAKSFQSAMFYLLMAFDHCQEDPMISICMAVASLGRAMQRQCDNRHHLITQAIAFIARYRAFRALQGDNVVEIEYNIGRTLHQLALYGHAARHYERALAAATIKPADTACMAEAAYNLSMIYVATGARQLAIELHRRWLSF
ncbi:TPR-like protein [Mycena vitilis]|nr:TPR-like protein [Mycena vitilis]